MATLRVAGAVFAAMLVFASPAHALNSFVGTTGDQPDANPGDGLCQTVVPSCTLRAAIQESNAIGGADTIVFNLMTPATINLTGVLPDIAAGGLTIQGPGPGPGAVTVRRDTGGDYRIFAVPPGAELNLSGLTISNGLARTVGNTVGGGIANLGMLNLDGVTVTQNSAIADFATSSLSQGGGIFNSGQMSIVRSTISANTVSASGGANALAVGGGIADFEPATSDISDSTLSANQATTSATSDALSGGGGLYTSAATKLTNVTVSGNTTAASGVFVDTVGGGVATNAGGATTLKLTITSSTIASNNALDGSNLVAFGLSSMSLRNTIVSNPLGGSNCERISGGTITSAGFNLASDTSCVLASTGDQQGTDPQLAALANNGGPTQTRAPACGGPATDQGSGAASGIHPAVTSDQRGDGRPVDLAAANAVGGDGSDVGALERQGACISPYAAAVLADGPAGYWRFGDVANPLTDSSGNANHGTYVNGVALGVPGAIAGDPDTAATYDGVNDYGTVPDSASLHVGTSFSLEGWIKRSSTSKSHQMMLRGNGFQLVVMNAGSGNQVWLRKANVTTLARSSGGISDTAYHHVVATINGPGSSAKIYIDGVDQTVIVSAPQSIPDTPYPIIFGIANSTSAQFDEFALYPEVLSPARVSAHHAAGVPAM